MDGLYNNGHCKPEKCCAFVELETGSKVIGALDTLSFVFAILAALRIVTPTSYTSEDLSSVQSSFRLIYWLEIFVYAFRTYAFLKAQKNNDAEAFMSWWKIRITTWAFFVFLCAIYTVYIAFRGGLMMAVYFLILTIVELGVDLHFCKTIQVISDDKQ